MPGTKIVNTISRSAEILKIIARGYNRLEDIYPLVDLNKSTTHRLLKSLLSSGLVFQSTLNRNYYLGPLFLRLSSDPTVAHQMLILCSIDELRRLRDSTGETVFIIIPNGDKRLVLKEVPSKKTIALSLGEGNTAPLYVGSSGRTLLAQYTNVDLDKILKTLKIVPFGPKTIKNVQLLKKEIDNIRKKGFGTSSNETIHGGTGISVPLEGYYCPIVLSVFGPEDRFNPMNILNELSETAIRISSILSQNLKGIK